MKLIKTPNKILRNVSAEVKFPLDEKTISEINYMVEWIKDSQTEGSEKREGLGMAAPQIGVSKRMFHVNINEINDTFINPKIIGKSESMAALSSGEGCLSVDQDYRGLVPRHFKIIVEAYSFNEQKEVTLTLVGFESMVFQHEIDHLDGKLYFDKIDKENPLKDKDKLILI